MKDNSWFLTFIFAVGGSMAIAILALIVNGPYSDLIVLWSLGFMEMIPVFMVVALFVPPNAKDKVRALFSYGAKWYVRAARYIAGHPIAFFSYVFLWSQAFLLADLAVYGKENAGTTLFGVIGIFAIASAVSISVFKLEDEE